MTITFKIFRFDPVSDAEPYFQEFIHEPKPADSILDTLKDIRDQQDPTIAFRYSCREAVCGSCALVVNGEICLACRKLIETIKSDVIIVEPLPNLHLLKDLFVDMTPFWKAYERVEPYLQAQGEVPEKGHRVEEEKMERVFQYITCILCASCYAACPVASRDERYVGPAALAKLHRFIVDPRDKRTWASLKKVDDPTGAWGCDTVFRCNQVCPKEVEPADGIEGVRRTLVARRIKNIVRREK
jgi:succinate dehydrogenase / fumarate reductase, iron-sulfur subunit